MILIENMYFEIFVLIIKDCFARFINFNSEGENLKQKFPLV